MSHTTSGRSLEKVLLAIVGVLLIFIGVVSFTRSILVPAEPALPPDRTGPPTADDFTTVFTLAENSAAAFKAYQENLLFRTLLPLVLGGIGVLYAGTLLIYRAIFNLKSTRAPYTLATVSAIALFGGVSGWQLLNDINVQGLYNCARLQGKYDSRQYKIAEGGVHVDHIQAESGHDKGDVIQVGNASLEISYFVSTCAYRQSIAHGGILTEGTYARVYYTDNYYPDENPLILRIDIKNP